MIQNSVTQVGHTTYGRSKLMHYCDKCKKMKELYVCTFLMPLKDKKYGNSYLCKECFEEVTDLNALEVYPERSEGIG